MKNVEKKIKKDANNTSFEFKEEYWSDALVKLKYAERMLLIKRFFWVVGIVVLLGGASYFTYNALEKIETDNNTLATTDLVKNNDNFNEVTEEKTDILFEQKESASLLEKDRTKSKPENSLPALNTGYKKESYREDKTIINSLLENSNIDNQSGEENISNNPYSKNGKNNTQNFNNQKQNSLNSDLKNDKDKLSNDVEGEYHINTSNTTNKDDDLISKDDKVTPDSENKTDTNEEDIEEDSSAKNLSQDESLVVNENKLKDSIGDKNQENDSNQNQPEKPAVEVKKSGLKSSVSLQIFAGGLISRNLNESNNINSSVPYFGLELNYKFSQPISISSGVGFYSRKINSNTVDYFFDEYNFGLNRTTATFTLKSANWLEIPLKLNYNFYKGHFISLGGTYSLNLSAINDITTNLSFSNEDELTANNQIETDFKNYTGFYNNTFSALISYKYMHKRFGGEVSYHYGLGDMLNDDKMKSVSIDRNNRLTFTLIYSLF